MKMFEKKPEKFGILFSQGAVLHRQDEIGVPADVLLQLASWVHEKVENIGLDYICH